MVVADIKAFYHSIVHEWVMENVPMDKHVLKELLRAGHVIKGELFPADEIGISEGASLSPYIDNFVLDGLQKYIYNGLYGTENPEDYSDGDLTRYADDLVVTC